MLHNLNRNNKYKVFRNAIHLLFKNCLSLLWGQIIYIFFSVLILTPSIPTMFNLALKVSGYSYITRNNIGRFIINPFTIFMLLLLFLVIGVFLLFEASYLITFYSYIENGKPPRQVKVYLSAAKRVLAYLYHKNFKLIPMVWVTVLASNLPLILFIIKRSRMLRYYSEQAADNQYILPFLVMIPLLLLLFMFRNFFVFQYCTAEGQKLKNARSNSNILLRNRVFRTVFYFAVWNLGITVVGLALYLFIMAVSTLFVIGIPDNNLAVATFLTINDRLNEFMIIGIMILNLIANFALYTHLFYQYKLEENENLSFKKTSDIIVIKVGSYKKVFSISLVILTLVNFYFFYDIIRNGSPLDFMNLNTIQVSSHRGFSHDVPENTIPAIEKAIKEQADFVEVDVRMTQDGELVLLHDNNLKRTTGLNKKIWQVPYARVAGLDAGSWMSEEYTGIRIPTLKEVLELCKGKINLNLDLKYRSGSEGLEDKVVAMIEDYNMERQCVLTSTNLLALERVKTINPDIRTGYITYQVFGSYFRNQSIDVFSVKSALITKSVVQEIHKHGKEVFVWTVNNRSELERMKRIGVDNVITDNPAYAKSVLYSEDSNLLLFTLFKIMLE